MLSWQHSFSSGLVNEAKLSFNRTNYRSLTANQASPSISLSSGRPLGDISIGGIPPVGNNIIFPLGPTSNVFELSDNLSYRRISPTFIFVTSVQRCQTNR